MDEQLVKVDIAIVGFGLVGQFAGALFGRLGYNVLIIEKQATVYPLPRVGHIDHEIMRLLQLIINCDEFESMCTLAASFDWMNQDGQTLLSLDGITEQCTSWRQRFFFHQADLEDLMIQSIKRAKVRIWQGHEVVAFTQSEDWVDIRVQSDGSKQVQAKYFLGADGANSFVRRQLGISWIDLGFRAPWLVVDFKFKNPSNRPNMPEACQFCDPQRPSSLFRNLGKYHGRCEFMLKDGENEKEMVSHRSVWKLLRRWVSPEDVTVVRSAVYTFKSAIASQWRVNRVILVGDSAHQMPPFLGQGMSSGMRDAVNLGWKLDMVFKNQASSDILDLYEIERSPHARKIINLSCLLGAIICEQDVEKATERFYSPIFYLY